jgi:hypothetical protein
MNQLEEHNYDLWVQTNPTPEAIAETITQALLQLPQEEAEDAVTLSGTPEELITTYLSNKTWDGGMPADIS